MLSDNQHLTRQPSSTNCYGQTFKTFINSAHFLTITLSMVITAAIISHQTINHTYNQISVLAATDQAADPSTLAAMKPIITDQQPPAEPAVNFTYLKGKLHVGDTLSHSLKRYQVTPQVRNLIIQELTGLLNFNDLRPGDHYSLVLDEDGRLIKYTFEADPLNVYTIIRTAEGYLTEKATVALTRQTVKISGIVYSSLFTAFAQHIKDPRLVYAFADIFASQIDFNTRTRQGDRFSVVFEKYIKDDQFVGFGQILMARYETVRNEILEGFFYTSEQTASGFFDAEGHGLGSSFIRSPVPIGRISSKFTFNRKHPILNVIRPHLGIDIAAPMGTPIMAAAAGRVRFIGWNGGFGKQVVLDHSNGFRTYYGHLSKFRKGLKRGAQVAQKQIIGYVGSTGLSTGPHLDYRIRHNGILKDPLSLDFTPTVVLTGIELQRFQQTRVSLTATIKSLDDFKIIQVKNIVLAPESNILFL